MPLLAKFKRHGTEWYMPFFRLDSVPHPVSIGVVTFLAGVLAHAAFPFDPTPPWIWIGIVISIAIPIVSPATVRWVALAGIVGIAFGLWRFDLTLPLSSRAPGDGPTQFTGTVVEEGRYNILVRDDVTGAKIAVGKRFRTGERVRVSCARLESLPHEPDSVFDARKGAWISCRGNVTVSRLTPSSGWNPQMVLGEWRTALTRRIQAMMPGDAGALLSGILYGERGLSADTSAAFKSAGMTHLIAVSGSNIAIVISLFVPFFLALGYRRKTAILLSGAAIVLFVLFVGAQASVVRAALMGWMALLARVFGRKASAGRLLLIAAAIIVVFDPWALAFDAGFALSFLATWGLLTWSRPLQERLKWIPEFAGLREAASTTLAATLVTLPYSLWAFQSASLLGLLTNLFAVPLGGLAMMWGAVAVAIGPLIPFAALPGRGCLEAMLLIARTSEWVPWMQFSVPLPTWALCLLYGVLFLYAQRQRYPHVDATQAELSPVLKWVVGKSGQHS